ncbi:hypothetical protein LZ30DRAFT_730475 [Colletotrichum cereale]|nr:hypothetical protein LZ30DRAFT_730475 [Colletotrichum cereale]
MYLAITLLYLAKALQSLYSPTPNAHQPSLIQSASVNSSTSDWNQLTGSQEGLVCLILETVYYINTGNLRHA